MKQAVEFANIDIYYQDFGKGTPVVLLHGYLESGEIWEAFAKELSKQYRIILIDLPGHGDSGSAGEIHSMDFMADSVARVLDRLHLETCFMIGHSMGGYVALAFLETYPYKLGGLVLFHSHPLADSMETKANREREIKLVRDGRKDLIFNTNIPKAFAVGNLNKFRKEVNLALDIAGKTPEKGIIAALNGMMERPDRKELLKNAKIPFLWILGKKDNYIPFDVMIEKVELPAGGKLAVLDHSGHQGFMEEKQVSLDVLSDFISLVNN